MFELLTELPWRPVHFDKNEWLKNYTVARYGKANPTVQGGLDSPKQFHL